MGPASLSGHFRRAGAHGGAHLAPGLGMGWPGPKQTVLTSQEPWKRRCSLVTGLRGHPCPPPTSVELEGCPFLPTGKGGHGRLCGLGAPWSLLPSRKHHAGSPFPDLGTDEEKGPLLPRTDTDSAASGSSWKAHGQALDPAVWG